MKERIFNLYKPIIFFALGILLLIFNSLSYTYLHVTIGVALVLYGLFDALQVAFSEEFKEEIGAFFYGLIEIVLGIILFTKFGESIEKVAIIWAIWSILREAREIGEVLNEYKSKPVMIASAIESLVVIVLSIILLVHPTAHHIIEHLYILGVEFLLAIIFPFLDKLFGKDENKEAKKKK